MKPRTLIMAGLPMIAVTYGFARFSYGLVLPYIRESLGISMSLAGVISSSSYLAYCIAITIAMVYMHKIGYRALILVAGAAAVAGMGIISLASGPFLLGTGIFIAGLSTGLVSPPYAGVVRDWVHYGYRAQANTWINAGTSLGTALTGIMVVFLGSNWRLMYILFTLIAVIILMVNYRTVPRMLEWDQYSRPQFFHVSKRDLVKSYPLVGASLMLGISSAAYWTFSRDFLFQLENIPDALTKAFWVIIGLSGVLGGFAGTLTTKIGVSSSYLLSVILLGSASLLIGLFTNFIPVSLSAIAFGGSYIFMTGVLIIWGVNVFVTNASFGLGLPFLMLAVGQILGSLIGGLIAGFTGYEVMFIIFGLIGFMALLFRPTNV